MYTITSLFPVKLFYTYPSLRWPGHFPGERHLSPWVQVRTPAVALVLASCLLLILTDGKNNMLGVTKPSFDNSSWSIMWRAHVLHKLWPYSGRHCWGFFFNPRKHCWPRHSPSLTFRGMTKCTVTLNEVNYSCCYTEHGKHFWNIYYMV